MRKKESHTSNLLRIDVTENKRTIDVEWSGRSIDRTPSQFITPILIDVLKKNNGEQRRIILDFRDLEYMNSSTITPIIKILERAKRGQVQMSVFYKKSLKWQDLNFSALEIFQTKDKRIEIKGSE